MLTSCLMGSAVLSWCMCAPGNRHTFDAIVESLQVHRSSFSSLHFSGPIYAVMAAPPRLIALNLQPADAATSIHFASSAFPFRTLACRAESKLSPQTLLGLLGSRMNPMEVSSAEGRRPDHQLDP